MKEKTNPVATQDWLPDFLDGVLPIIAKFLKEKADEKANCDRTADQRIR